MPYARRPDTCTTPPLHVTYTQQGDEAGDNGPEMAVGARIPVQTEREERAGQAGYSDAQIQNGDFRQRLFLAWTRRLQAVCTTQDQFRLLAHKDRTESN